MASLRVGDGGSSAVVCPRLARLTVVVLPLVGSVGEELATQYIQHQLGARASHLHFHLFSPPLTAVFWHKRGTLRFALPFLYDRPICADG